MMTLGLVPDAEGAFPDESLAEYRRSLKWLLWAQHAAENVLQWSVEDLVLEVADDPARGKQVLNIYKILVVERSSAAFREAVAEQMLDHVRAVLQQSGISLREDLFDTPIDYAVVPKFFGLEPDEVNCLVVNLQKNMEIQDVY